MTFLELCKRLRQEVGAAGTGPASVTNQGGEYARLVSWVAESWHKIEEARQNWPFDWKAATLDLDAAFRDYSPPSDLSSLDHDTLYIGDDKVRYLPWTVFREQYRKDSNAAKPSVLTTMPDGTWRFDTSPSAALTFSFEYYRKPQALAANNDTPRMPEQYHMLIVYMAMLDYALYENAPEVATAAREGIREVEGKLVQNELPTLKMPEPLA